jgi:RNA polymerase sigma-70 factor (ECF subfamily)
MEAKTVDLSSIQLLNTLRAGDITAFEMIFKTYYQPLCNYAYSFVQDRDEAEEIVQSTFLSVWEKREDLAIHTSVKPYLYAMVRNAALNVIKHEKVKQQHAAVEVAVAEKSTESVTRTVMAAELEDRIYKALNKLPEQCRLVFKLSRFEELKYAEIADQLNISVKTVENQMGKALRIMREQLKDYLPLLIVLLSRMIE